MSKWGKCLYNEMISLRVKIRTLIGILKYDLAEFSIRSGKKAHVIADSAGVSRRMLQGLYNPEKFKVSVKTLAKVEKEFERDPCWPGYGGSIWRETSNNTSFTISRPKDNWQNPVFADVINS